MGKIILTFLIAMFTFVTVSSQKLNKSLVKISKNDSVQIIKKQNNYFITFYYIDKIQFNKKQIKQKLVDGKIYCEKCVKDSYSISVKPININPCNFENITVDEFLSKRNGYADYFRHKNKYYKYNGRIIE